jgi:RNA polymerase sigma factor (sigma-70 family)
MQRHQGGKTMSVATVEIAPGTAVTELVINARKGDQQAWHALVRQYSPLVRSVCRRYQLNQADAEDVAQTVWLRLFNQLDGLCEPAALPGWLSTTTWRECSRVRRVNGRAGANEPVTDLEAIPDQLAVTADQALLAAERASAVREAFSRLPFGGQQLLSLLLSDPPIPYAEISARLGIAIGTIGPARRRCLQRLRRDPAIVALLRDAGIV